MLINYLKAMSVFSTVVETGNFTSAGEKLSMPRSKVSEQVARLEEYLGVKLFTRSTRKVTVTEEGIAFHSKVKNILLDATQGVEEVKSFEDKIKGLIKITATQDHYEALLLPILKEFSSLYPLVDYEVQIGDDAFGVIDESIDIAIRAGELPDSSLISRPLKPTRLKLYCGREFNHHFQCPTQLADVKWIVLKNSNQPSSTQLINESGDVQLVAHSQFNCANNIASYLPMIEQGFGIGVLAEVTGKHLMKTKQLREVLPDWYVSELPLSLVYPARKTVAKRTQLLLDFMYQKLG